MQQHSKDDKYQTFTHVDNSEQTNKKTHCKMNARAGAGFDNCSFNCYRSDETPTHCAERHAQGENPKRHHKSKSHPLLTVEEWERRSVQHKSLSSRARAPASVVHDGARMNSA